MMTSVTVMQRRPSARAVGGGDGRGAGDVGPSLALPACGGADAAADSLLGRVGGLLLLAAVEQGEIASPSSEPTGKTPATEEGRRRGPVPLPANAAERAAERAALLRLSQFLPGRDVPHRLPGVVRGQRQGQKERKTGQDRYAWKHRQNLAGRLIRPRPRGQGSNAWDAGRADPRPLADRAQEFRAESNLFTVERL